MIQNQTAAPGTSGRWHEFGAAAHRRHPVPQLVTAVGRERAEREVLAAVSAHRPVEAQALLDEGNFDPLFSLLAHADIRLRYAAIDVPELRALRDHVAQHASGSSALAWAWAMLADRLLIRGDPACVLEARRALDLFPDDADHDDVVFLYARSRLLRVAAARYWLYPVPEGLDQYGRLHDEAVNCLLRCDFTEEVSVARAVAAALLALFVGEDLTEGYQRARAVRATLPLDQEHGWALVLDFLAASLALLMGDYRSALSLAERLETAAPAPPMTLFPAYARSVIRLVDDGPTDEVLRAVDASTDAMRPYPLYRQVVLMRLSHLLLDLRCDAAGRVIEQALELPPATRLADVEYRLVRVRLASMDGRRPDMDEVDRLLGELEALGQRRTAARHALALSHDLASLGETGEATRIHNWGMERLPLPIRRTSVERRLSRALQDPAEPLNQPPAPLAQVRVLAPRLHVEVAGRPARLGDTSALLLVGLVAAHPWPLHIEQVSNLLWPGRELTAVRSRLTTVTHRLRQALGPAGAAVRRTGDLLALDPRGLSCDLWRHREAVAAGGEPSVRALTSVRGALCNTQFPYTEGFVDERERFIAEWVRHARAALATGAVNHEALTPALRALDMRPYDLA